MCACSFFFFFFFDVIQARRGRSVSNPFKEMERQREEERRKKYEKFLNK